MKIVATVIVLTMCLFAGSVYAADATYNWSGVYGGLSMGYVHATEDWKVNADPYWAQLGAAEESFTFDQFDIGGHIGAQYQLNWLVLGGEFSIFKGPHDEQSKPSPVYPASNRWNADIHTVFKAVAKAGFAYNRFLFYGKGGYAGARVDTEVVTLYPYPNAIGTLPRCKTSEWHSGWTVGGGVEYALSKHWIVGAEFDYVDFGSKTHTTHASYTAWVGRPPVLTTTPIDFRAGVDAAEYQVLLRVSYLFDLF
jgi:outer membrane immunogenic protein